PKRDIVYTAARNALVADGWTITHDPYVLPFGEQKLFVDLGAEAPIAAEKAGRKIAIEIKSFVGKSSVTDLQRAIGQYAMYEFLLQREEPDRAIFLAVSEDVYDEVLDVRGARELVTGLHIRILVFDLESERITRWIE